MNRHARLFPYISVGNAVCYAVLETRTLARAAFHHEETYK